MNKNNEVYYLDPDTKDLKKPKFKVITKNKIVNTSNTLSKLPKGKNKDKKVPPNPKKLEKIKSSVFIDGEIQKIIGKVPFGGPNPLTIFYRRSVLPEYAGFVLDEERILIIKPCLCLSEDGHEDANLWVKKVGNAPVIIQDAAPSAVPLTEINWPTYEIRLYRGAQPNDDFPVDNHRFVFINDAKSGFRRFIHEWELYSRTTGVPELLAELYTSDEQNENAGHAFFPLWHEGGHVDSREKMPRAWTASSQSRHKLKTGNDLLKSRLLAQSLVWCRLAHRAQTALRDGWSVYARYWDKEVKNVTVYLQLDERIKKKVSFKLLKEMADAFPLNFKPTIKEVSNLTQLNIDNKEYKLLGTHVLGFFEVFIKPKDYARLELEGMDRGMRPFPDDVALQGVLQEFTNYFRKKKSINVAKLSGLLKLAIATLGRNDKSPLNNIFQALSTLPQKNQGAHLPILTNLITFLGDLPSDDWQDLGTTTHVTSAKIATASIYKERNPSQIEVMKISATKVAECFWKGVNNDQLFPQKKNFNKTAEWLHRSAFSFGGLGNKSVPNSSQVPGNLVFGTYEANTAMLRYESSIKNLSMLEEEISDEARSVVETSLAFNAPEWPANIKRTQSWLAPYLIYEWKFRCTPVKTNTMEHTIELFSTKIPTRFEAYLDELVESLVYSKEI